MHIACSLFYKFQKKIHQLGNSISVSYKAMKHPASLIRLQPVVREPLIKELVFPDKDARFDLLKGTASLGPNFSDVCRDKLHLFGTGTNES